MRNVNELKNTNNEGMSNTTPTQETISLSSIKQDTPISITASTGAGLVDNSDKMSNPTVNLNPHRIIRRGPTPSRNINKIKQIDPNEYIEKPKEPELKSFREKALGILDEAMMRKKEEYNEFVQHALEEDKANRELVENGLESVGDELQYLPDELHVPITEEEKVKVEEHDDDDYYSNFMIQESDEHNNDQEDYEIDDNFTFDFTENTNVRMGRSLFDSLETPDDKEYSYIDEPEIIEAEVIDKPEIIDVETYSIDDNDKTEEEHVKDDVPSDTISEIDEDVIYSKPINVTNSVLDNDMIEAATEDFELDEHDIDETSTSDIDNSEELPPDEIMKISNASEKRLKSEILQKIIQVGKKMDTTQFVVSNKVINIKDAMKGMNTTGSRTAIWPLTYAGRPYKASALKGSEIAMLADADNSESRGSVGLTMEQARILFEHDANPYRPSSLEKWAKTIPFSDLENIFAAIYVASLKGSNYIPMVCPKMQCQHAYLSENIEINNLIKFESDKAKERFEEIKNMEITPENTGSYESVVNVINDRFAVGLKIPSIFTVLYEYNFLNKEFIKKYTAMVSITQYIDYIYFIDPETSQFQPIGWKTYPGDNGKSFKSKIATYAKILKELDDTDFTVLLALINSMITKNVESRGISYEIPSEKCPKCGTKIEERSISARGLVFMRQRLVELATTPLKK